MKSLTSVDLRAIMQELKELEGSKVDRIQQIGDEVRLRLYKKEKKELVIKSGVGVWLTKYAKEAPKEPGNFCMLLRKHIGNGKVKAIRQAGFDRIIEVEFEGGYKLIAELFAKGNIIFCKDGEILHALKFEEWKDRSIKPKKTYKPPPQSKNLPELSEEEFASTLKKSTKDLVRTLVMDLNLAGTYAEEACKLAGIEKSRKAVELGEAETKKIFDAVKVILEKAARIESPQIAGGIAAPFRLETLGDGKAYPTFNEAVDDYLTLAEGTEDNTQAENLRKKKIDKAMAKLAEQEKAVELLAKEAEENRSKGELVKSRAQEMEGLLRQAKLALKAGETGIKELEKKYKGIKLKILPSEQKLTVEIGD